MKDGAPEAWRIMIRQQELNALTIIGTLLLTLIIGLFIVPNVGSKTLAFRRGIQCLPCIFPVIYTSMRRCGLEIDRDHNAALNILNRGLVYLTNPRENRAGFSG